MESALALLQTHGVLALCIVVFAKRMGLPVPALPFLLVTGANGVHDAAFVLRALLAGWLAAVVADALWFFAGRRYGRAVLAVTCRISLAPGTCIRQSERVFARYGVLAVLFAKFIPGVAGLAPPLAAALGMRGAQFLLLNGAGTVLWIGSGLAAGVAFARQVNVLLRSLELLGNTALPLLAGALAAYVAWLAVRRTLARRRAALAPADLPQQR